MHTGDFILQFGMKARIGVMDSGCGGLSVLRELRKEIPSAEYIYYSDNANCPYGTKSAEFITERCRKISEHFIEKGASIIVIACNTATSAAIATLRKEFGIPFVGMEPAVKPAVGVTRSGVIGVLATEGTLKGTKYLDMKEQWGENTVIMEAVGRGFVELVEKGEISGERAEEICRRSLAPLLEAGADTIVLGCTHYPFLLPVLQKAAEAQGYGGVRFINPAPAVAKRVRSLLDKENDEDGKGSIELISSGDGTIMRKIWELSSGSEEF